MTSALEKKTVSHKSGRRVLDTPTDRHVASPLAAGTSWSEVNPAAVRTDGGPGSRFLDFPYRCQDRLDSTTPFPTPSEAPCNCVSHPQPWFEVSGSEGVSKVAGKSEAFRETVEVLSVVLLYRLIKLENHCGCSKFTRQIEQTRDAGCPCCAHIRYVRSQDDAAPPLRDHHVKKPVSSTMALVLEVQGSLAGSPQRTQFRSHLRHGSRGHAHDSKCESLRLRFVNEESSTLGQHHANVRRNTWSSNGNIRPVDNPKPDVHPSSPINRSTPARAGINGAPQISKGRNQQ